MTKIQEVFANYEDMVLEKSLLVGVAPASMIGTQLLPKIYNESGEEKIKCTVIIESSEDLELDEDTMESIADTVNDWTREKGIGKALTDVGVDPDLLDWWTVEVEVV